MSKDAIYGCLGPQAPKIHSRCSSHSITSLTPRAFGYPVERELGGSVTLNAGRSSVVLPHLTGEWKGRDGNMGVATLQSAYDGVHAKQPIITQEACTIARTSASFSMPEPSKV